ncbi:MAG: thiazole biosynthesis adenylyltransferase ThiF [Planctomycetes bacterium]|nr:thiazole biosynthesis adenylyltransferase ThiF [Planctomycetota bacterium]
MGETSDDLETRYSRQMRFAPIGEAGQRRLATSRALVCGCGALGSVIAGTLARAGVGKLRIVDRDFVELSNLQRQSLYDEEDARSGLPKAIAAQAKLQAANSTIEIEPIVADIDASNIEAFVEGVDVILDGTDNFEIRYLLNDAAIRYGIPWVFGGCLGAEGQTMTILPGTTACLRCVIPEPPAPGASPTCDAAGIVAPIIQVIASIEAMEAIKILTGQWDAVSRDLVVFDLWTNETRRIALGDAFPGFGRCACQGRDFPWLDRRRGSHSAVLCGRNAVQLSFPESADLSLEQLRDKLETVGRVTMNRFLLRLEVGPHVLTVFRDGRTIVGGTSDIAEARSLHARYVGA